MTISPFFSMACKVRNNREEIEEKEKRGRNKRMLEHVTRARSFSLPLAVEAPKASLHSRNSMGISVSSLSRGRKLLLEAEATKQSP
ncbi:hypothetical protein QYF61_026309 [Mycteria americana]|uniref:Uncharacterized protein n=1 Tax=Mycteria americana TaxID=33587 RepID=A0AAN7RSK8_MYCAM|nr:hypothetical protein QYF61_026309 [Mycteria americana]